MPDLVGRADMQQPGDSSEVISDLCVVKVNDRLKDSFLVEMARRLWSKAATFGIAGHEQDGVYVETIKDLESRDVISFSQQVVPSSVS